MKEWLRAEWRRAGLPLALLNAAAGVKNAATRKWFTQDHLWYFPPPEAMERIAAYAQRHGAPTTRPYFSLDGTPLTAAQWEPLRAKWNHAHGVTNVWRHPTVRGEERIKVASKSLHANQKPVALMERIITASSDPGDVVWDVFAGVATGAVAARQHRPPLLQRRAQPGVLRARERAPAGLRRSRVGSRRRSPPGTPPTAAGGRTSGRSARG